MKRCIVAGFNFLADVNHDKNAGKLVNGNLFLGASLVVGEGANGVGAWVFEVEEGAVPVGYLLEEETSTFLVYLDFRFFW